MLLSTGEQVSASKLAILLNLIGYKSISLNGYQAQIYTNNNYQNASIIKIDTERIKKELKENIVIITGFQGIDENNNITTLTVYTDDEGRFYYIEFKVPFKDEMQYVEAIVAAGEGHTVADCSGGWWTGDINGSIMPYILSLDNIDWQPYER